MAAKFGLTFSPPGTGICHQLHLENFAKPGKTLVGSDSHTPTAGGVGSMEKCTGCATCAKLCPDVAIKVWRTVKSKAKENANVG